jgi:hypothetical protein
LPNPKLTSAIQNEHSLVSGSLPARKVEISRWLRFLLPSTSVLIFVLLLIAFSTGSLPQKLLGDAGIGWHIRTGQLILQTHAVPRADPFSSTMQGQPWFAWEWLYDVIVGSLERATGLNGIVFATALVIAGTFAFAFRQMIRRGSGLLLAIALLVLALVASSIHFLARPHVFSWLLSLIYFELLRDFELLGNVRRLIWLPILMLVWVNVHGGFLVGLVLVALYLVAFIFEAFFASDQEAKATALHKTKALGVAGVACALATFANPYSYRLHEHIYKYLTDTFLMDHIDEFLSPNFHGIAQKCFALLILLTIATAAMSRRKIAMSKLLVIGFAVYSGLYAVRSIPVSSLLLVLFIGPHLSREAGSEITNGLKKCLIPYVGFEDRMSALDLTLRGYWLPVAAILVGIWVCLHAGKLDGAQIMNANFDAARFPVQAVDWLRNQEVRGPVFCPDSWGGYVIYRAYPELKVVIDDRHDFYGSEYLKKYLKIIRVEPDWDPALAATKPAQVLLPARSAAATLLRQVPAWTVAYSDPTAVVFRRAEK